MFIGVVAPGMGSRYPMAPAQTVIRRISSTACLQYTHYLHFLYNYIDNWFGQNPSCIYRASLHQFQWLNAHVISEYGL